MKNYQVHKISDRAVPESLDQLLAECGSDGWALHSFTFCSTHREFVIVLEHDELEGASPITKRKSWGFWK